MLREIEVLAGQTCDYFDRRAFYIRYPHLACCQVCKHYVPKQLLPPQPTPEIKENPPDNNNYDSHG
jgi:hypothetical protein